MDLDWCLICEQKTNGTLYCGEECKFKDYLSAYTLTSSESPTSSGSSTPTSSTSNVSIVTNNSFAYPFYRKPSLCFQQPPNIDHKNNTAIGVLLPTVKKSQSTVFRNTIEMPPIKDSNADLARSLDTRHLHI